MEPQSEAEQPTIWVTMHLPATSWHRSVDQDFEEQQPTEWEVWAETMWKMLQVFTAGNARLMVGYWLDALNTLPSDIRRALIAGIARGYGLDISSSESEPDTVDIRLIPRYPPLASPKVTPRGLVLPRRGGQDLILPK